MQILETMTHKKDHAAELSTLYGSDTNATRSRVSLVIFQHARTHRQYNENLRSRAVCVTCYDMPNKPPANFSNQV